MKKHAILFSGGINYTNNWSRYKNDLEFAYRVLIEDCNFRKEEIEVLYANGRGLYYDGVAIDTKPAMKNTFLKSLSNQKNLLNKEDTLVFMVSNHGGDDNGGTICCWGEGCRVPLSDIVDILNTIEAKKIIVLGQCYAGNILDYEIENSCVITANMKDLESYTNPNKKQYDELFYHFLSYIHGKYPDGEKLLEDGENDIDKAFQYAAKWDVFAPGNREGEEINNKREKEGKSSIIEIPQKKCNLEGVLML